MPNVRTSETVATRDYSLGGPVQHQERISPGGYASVPPKANGGFITLPDGSKFRKTTTWGRFRSEIERGGAASESGQRRDTPTAQPSKQWLKTSNGGYWPDYVFASQLYGVWKDIPDVGFGYNGIIEPPGVPYLSGNEAKTKALLKLADSTANLGENFATLGQTLRMLHAPVSSIAEGIKSVARNRSLRPYMRESLSSLNRQGILTASAKKYLEYVYGWKPLMQDIHGLIQYAKERGIRPLLLSSSATASRSVAVKPAGYDSFSEKVRVDVTGGIATSKVRCKLWARIDPNWSGTRALNQLGLANPAALAWELTSLSFVVDWILPIGQVLNALTAPAGLVFVNGSLSNRLSCSASYEEIETLVKGQANWSYDPPDPATGNIKYEGYTRQELTGWPKPGVWIDPDPLRSDRGLKATALLIAGLKSYR